MRTRTLIANCENFSVEGQGENEEKGVDERERDDIQMKEQNRRQGFFSFILLSYFLTWIMP